jgi:twitching motility protein PilJ
MLTQRIGKSAGEFLTQEGVSPEAVFLLGQGPQRLPAKSPKALLNGSSAELGLSPARDATAAQQPEDPAGRSSRIHRRTQANAVLSNLSGLVAAREASQRHPEGLGAAAAWEMQNVCGLAWTRPAA